jgi:hypothetical protein
VASLGVGRPFWLRRLPLLALLSEERQMKEYDKTIVDQFVAGLREDLHLLVGFWQKLVSGGVVEGIVGEWQVKFGKLPGAWYRANVIYAIEEDLAQINRDLAKHYVEKARKEDERVDD